MDIFKNRIKPDLTKLSDSELHNIITTKLNQKCEYTSREELTKQIMFLWNQESIDNIECSICLDFITNGNNLMTECGHQYHSTCLFNSLMKTNKCPMCRYTLIDDNIYNISTSPNNDVEVLYEYDITINMNTEPLYTFSDYDDDTPW